MMQLRDLRVLDLRNCYWLKVIPRNVISSLSRLEYLSMKGCSAFKREKEGFNSGERINNACVSELKHLSCLRTLEVEVSDPSLLPEDADDVLFDNLNLTRYSIVIGDIWIANGDKYKASRMLRLGGVKRLHMVNCSKLLKRSQFLDLRSLNDTKDVVYELDKEGFVELKYLSISWSGSIQNILHFSTSVEWVPSPNTFCMLEELDLHKLDNLEAVCDGPIPMGFFGNLRILKLSSCNRLKYVFSSLPTQHGRELAFPRLQELDLGYLPVISFYSIGRSSGSEESVTFFNQQITFPSLEILTVLNLENVRALCHDQLSADSFPKLRELHVTSCDKLLNIFPSNNLRGLQSLQSLEIKHCNALEEIFDLDGFLELKYLTISWCCSIQYILHSSTSVEWAPPPNTFYMLEELNLEWLSKLEAVWYGPIPMGSFGNLRILKVKECRRLEYVFSFVPTQHGRELAFPRLQELELRDLPEVISFYSTRSSSGSEESVTFFNEQITFPSLEILTVADLGNVRALCHNQLSADSFPKLRELSIGWCNKLLNIFPSNNLKGLQSLQILEIKHCNALEEIFDLDGFLELKRLTISHCRSIQYILNSSTSVAWAPPPNTFFMLEQLNLKELSNLEAVWHGPIPMGLFGNLRILKVSTCERLKYVFSVPTQHGRESLDFPQLQSLKLRDLPEVISFYSIGRSSGSEESVTLFNQQITFPSLEILTVAGLYNVRALCHNQLSEDSFPKLRELNIRACDKLLNIFPSNNLKGLQSLQILEIKHCNALEEIFDLDGFLGLKRLTISHCRSIQYILHSSTSVAWTPPPNTFFMLEQVDLKELSNLEAVWHGPIPMGLFGNLRILKASTCERLKYVFSIPTQHGRESLAFPRLQELRLENLPEVISFYSIGRSSGSEESVALFNQQVAFPALESLYVRHLDNVRSLWHNQLPEDSFSKLKYLHISSCNKLLNVFPLSVVKALVQLEDLEIDYCGVLEAIVANENENENEDEATLSVLFPKLTSLKLDTFPQLKRFCSGRFTSRWPLLKKLEVRDCDKVEIFFEEMGLEGELDNKIQQSLFLVEKEAFPNLEELSLTFMDTMEIWRGKFSRVSFSELRVLNVTGCHGISVVISSNMIQILHNLEELKVYACNSVNEVIQVERLLGEEFHVDTLPRLTEIAFKDLPMLMHLSGLGPYFQSVRTLEISWCRSLINLGTPLMAKRLVQLETLIIRGCNMLEIVGNERDEPTDDEINFTRLKRLELEGLPNLESFCSARNTFRFPSLKAMSVEECPKMEFFCKGVLDTPRLKGWEGDLNTIIHKKFIEQNAQGYKEEDLEESDSINSDPREEDFKED